MGVAAEGLRHDLLKLSFDRVDVFTGRQAGAVANAKNVRVDGEGFLAEGRVEDDVGSLAADSGKFLE